MVNYIDLINHYAWPPGDRGFKRYQCFSVISPLALIPFISLSGTFTGFLGYIPLPKIFSLIRILVLSSRTALISFTGSVFPEILEKWQGNAHGILSQLPESLHALCRPAPKLRHQAKVTTEEQQGPMDLPGCQARLRRLQKAISIGLWGSVYTTN